MKLFRLFVGLLALLIPATASAHLPGQPPFTYVNGEPAVYYPVSYASLPDLGLPQDLALGTYVVNTDIAFALETSALPYFPEELPSIIFKWDFGDGTTFEGLETVHKFTKPGSKIVSIKTRDTRNTDPEQTLSTMFMQVAPSADYKLPEVVLAVNGQRVNDIYIDSIAADFNKKVTLDASKTKAGTAAITSYWWDLGNQQMAKDSKVTVTYNTLFSTVQPVVRVTDANGLYVDATVQLTNTTLPGPNTSAGSPSGRSGWLIGGLLAGAALIAGAAVIWWRRRPLAAPKYSRHR